MVDIKLLVEKLTLEEKAKLVIGKGPWQTVSIERLKIPSITVADGPHGVRRVENIEEHGLAKSIPATCFPPASSLASTWNPELLHEMGKYLGEECLSLGVDILLGPGVNIKRTPVCGRNFEYFSEDPFLTGMLASALVKGIQSKGIGTSLKHFTANNQEFNRRAISAVIDERTLWEIYLPAFEKVVKDAKPDTVMCAYNKLNGVYCSENYRTLQEILRDEWNFQGLVVSDWGAVHDPVASIQGSLDLQMPGPDLKAEEKIIEAVRKGTLKESLLNRAVERILKVVFKSKSTPKEPCEFDIEKHHNFAKKISDESIVLLKNYEQILPLNPNSSICIVGKLAKNPSIQAGGSADVNPTKVVSPFDAINDLVKDNSKIEYTDGYSEDPNKSEALLNEALDLVKKHEFTIIFAGYPRGIESEGYDRKSISLPQNQIKLIQSVSKISEKVIVVLNNGSAVSISEWIDEVPAIVEAWLGGQAIGESVADVIFGKINPSGKLPETFPKSLVDTPAYINYPGNQKEVIYGERFYVGYRYYDKKKVKPQFPFGFGLSYTTFEYSNLHVSKEEFTDEEELVVTFEVRNTGTMSGKEISQLYIHSNDKFIEKPVKELKGFVKTELQPKEMRKVKISLSWRDFAYYDSQHQQWIAPTGTYEIFIGSSLEDIHLNTTVSYKMSRSLPTLLNENSTLRDWFLDPKGKIIIEKFFKEFAAKQGINEPPDERRVESFLNLQLKRILNYVSHIMERNAEDLLKELLEQVYK